MKIITKSFAYALLLSTFSIPSSAKVSLPSFFTDNMVLQQKAAIPFWGTATPGSTVRVSTSWDKRVYTNHADKQGNWKITLTTPAYGGPYTITVEDETKTELKNILIGEVWLCSGQSNMEMPLAGWGKVNNYEEEIKNANYPEIRLLQAEHIDSAVPLNDLQVQNGGWQVCSPETIPEFSSTAYFFARKVYAETKIPIGLIHSSWGGTVIEAWTSAEALHTIKDFDAVIKSMKEDDMGRVQQKYEYEMKQWVTKLNDADPGMKNGMAWTAKDFNFSNWKKMQLPGFWENKGLPGFDGSMWFRKSITLPDNYNSEEAVLRFLADDNDNVWVNGSHIGATDGYNVQRNYKIPAGMLKKGKNEIVICVFDSGSGGGIYGAENDLQLVTNGNTYPLTGEWHYAVGADLANLPPAPYMPQGQNRPTALYNAMIHPLLQVPITGVIWYQGESNEARAHQYQKLFPLMINDWRNQFGIKDLPFYFVQLANYKQVHTEPAPSMWAELREAQAMALQLPNTGMAVATDIGDAEDIHPKNKQEVGERLARIALAKKYGKDIDYSGPVYKAMVKKGNSIVLDFDFAEGLKANSGKLKGFAVAGEDKKFYWAEAKIKDGKIVVLSSKVPTPVAVRYNWADNPQGNLTNASGLPAAPFRTDSWPGITYGKK